MTIIAFPHERVAPAERQAHPAAWLDYPLSRVRQRVEVERRRQADGSTAFVFISIVADQRRDIEPEYHDLRDVHRDARELEHAGIRVTWASDGRPVVPSGTGGHAA